MIVALLLAYVSAFAFYWFYWRRRHLPPGPIAWPFIGNLYEVVYGHPHPDFVGATTDWAKKYGPIHTWWFGNEPIVMVTDYEHINELIIKDSDTYSGRYFYDPLMDQMKISGGTNGITRNDRSWEDVRRFTLHKLRNLGMGRPRMEQKCIEFLQMQCQQYREKISAGQSEFNAFEIIDLFNGSVASFISYGITLFEGEKLKEYRTFRRQLNDFLQKFAYVLPNMLMIYPWLRYLPPFHTIYREIETFFCQLNKFYEPYITERIAQREQKKTAVGENECLPSDGESDYLDEFLSEVERHECKKINPPNNQFSLSIVNALLFDVHTTAMNNAGNQLDWLFILLLLDHRARHKLQHELDSVAATKSKEADGEVVFTIADRINLHYTNAVVEEAMRKTKLLPAVAVRRVTRDVKLGDYFLPKGTKLNYVPATVHNDERFFPDHQQFIPERFIDENGRYKKINEMMPFGVGRRLCIGEALSRTELFLFASNFFYNFDVFPASPLEPPSSEKVPSLTVRPAEYNAKLVPRKPSKEQFA